MESPNDTITKRSRKLRPVKQRTGIYLEQSMYEHLCALAQERNLSMNAVITVLLEMGLEQVANGGNSDGTNLSQ